MPGNCTMIKLNQLIPAATVNKTHGIHGEMSVTVDPDVTLVPGSCVITPIDSIPVPFFVAAIRPRQADTFLVRLDGVESDASALEFVGATFYVEPSALSQSDEDDDDDSDEEEGFYASMLIDSTLRDADGSVIGRITDIDDSTVNTLLIVERHDSTTVMVPLSADLIISYNPDEAILTMDIPEGLLDIQ